MSNYYGDFRNGNGYALIQRQLDALREQFDLTQSFDPATALELRHKMGLLQGQLETEFYAEDTQDWWCVWCERVSVQSNPLDGVPHCRYADCDPAAHLSRLVSEQFPDTRPDATLEHTPGERWSGVREDYHPEYPETAVVGVRYPVPELPVDLVRFFRPVRASA